LAICSSAIKTKENKKMSKNKTKMTIAITLVLLMATGILMVLPTQAQTTYTNLQEGGALPLPAGVTPDETIDTVASLSFTPNPIGVGQSLLVNLWVVPPIHVSRYFTDYKVTFTKPDGTKDTKTVDPYRGDSTAWYQYVPDQVGNWTLQFEFPGGYFPAGNYTVQAGAVMSAGTTSFTRSCYYKPSSSPVQTLEVQQDMVYSWPPSPLPTDYWIRPISPENRDWWLIGGSYPGTGYVGGGPIWDELYPGTNPAWSSQYRFTPWVQAPNSAHIVWKQQEAIDGLVGGPGGQSSLLTTPSLPSVIYAGRCYQTVTKVMQVLVNGTYRQQPTSVAECYDLRTGKVYYDIPTADGGVTPTIVSYTSTYATISGQPAVPGATAGAGVAPELLTITGGYLLKINPFSGAISTNVSISPLTGSGGTYYKNEFVLYVQNLGNSIPSSQRYRLINWTTAGTTTNFTARIIGNTTYAMSSLPSLIDYNVGIGASVSSLTPTSSTGVATETRITAYQLATGEQLWNVTFNENQYSSSCSVADHGKIAVLTEGGHFVAYDLATGVKAWQSEQMTYPWSSTSFGGYTIQSAYGMLFREGYDGVYAFNWDNGKIVWKYKASALPFETPYIDENGAPVYSFSWNGGGDSGTVIADGKLYTFNCEHTPSLPITRGWRLHCVNITTGEGIWNITAYAAAGAMADGYITVADTYDGYMYVFGRGQSQTTVSAPDVVVPLGNGVVIKGTVMDQSPAQPGTPCVSKDSMSTQMEYLHMQHPVDGVNHDVQMTGVPVLLTAIDENGTYIDIGEVTTSAYYGTFEMAWTPPAEGSYKIVASFAGDDSYGSSGAATAVSVGPTPEPVQFPEQVTPTDYTMTIVYAAVAIIVAVVIAVAIVGVLILRKR
jgi:hypothetical protein